MNPLKPAYIIGWKYGGNEYQQYLQRLEKNTPENDVPPGCAQCSWWPTRYADKGTRFKSIDAALTYFRKIFWYQPPEGNAETFIYDGSLQIFEDGAAGLRQIPRLTRQTSLFASMPEPEVVEQQPCLIQMPETADCFNCDEHKLLVAGYILVKYNRELKTIQQTYIPPKRGWAPSVTFGTFAAAERTLKEALAADNVVEVCLEDEVNMTSSSKKLYAAGFEFYRSEGIIPGHGISPRIKQGSKNWSTWGKYESPEELKAAWVELMKDQKALNG
jgi:hypothetical protein